MVNAVELEKVISEYLNDYDPRTINILTNKISSQAEMIMHQLIRENIEHISKHRSSRR